MLDGVTIINETRDYIAIIFCTIALIMVFIVNIIFIKDVLIIHNYGDRVLDKIHSISVEAVLVLCILVAGIGMIDGIVTPIYEVKISDDVNVTKFYDRYDVITKKDNDIFIVSERHK